MASVLAQLRAGSSPVKGREQARAAAAAATGLAGPPPAGSVPAGDYMLAGPPSPAPPMPQVRMPTGAPTTFPPPPPPPPCHAPPAPGPSQALAGMAALDAAPQLQEMLAAVSLTVAPMLKAATRASESQVGAEIRRLEAGFQTLQAKVSRVEVLLGMGDRGSSLGQLDALNKMLAEVGQRWDQEIRSVKRELHQTILAHNHNADVMADHKSAIDRIRAEIGESGPPVQPEKESQLQEQLDRLSHTLGQNRAREQDIDTLVRRSDALMQQFAALGVAHPMAMSTAHPSMLAYGPSLQVHPGLASMVA
uniref:Uncharacterized protein n=1 Tax=Alexandrium monilatum TaxID=311494 RepID=A0A7S4T7R9_9DINO